MAKSDFPLDKTERFFYNYSMQEKSISIIPNSKTSADCEAAFYYTHGYVTPINRPRINFGLQETYFPPCRRFAAARKNIFRLAADLRRPGKTFSALPQICGGLEKHFPPCRRFAAAWKNIFRPAADLRRQKNSLF